MFILLNTKWCLLISSLLPVCHHNVVAQNIKCVWISNCNVYKIRFTVIDKVCLHSKRDHRCHFFRNEIRKEAFLFRSALCKKWSRTFYLHTSRKKKIRKLNISWNKQCIETKKDFVVCVNGIFPLSTLSQIYWGIWRFPSMDILMQMVMVIRCDTWTDVHRMSHQRTHHAPKETMWTK